MENERKICALRTELAALRQRIEYLEKQLRLTQCHPSKIDCHMDRRMYSDHYHGYSDFNINGNEPPAESRSDRQFTERKLCAFCQEAHPIRTCKYFRYLQIGDRWIAAKKLGLCYRCLDNNHRHLGKDCPNTRICRIKGCHLLHDRLLHDPDRKKLRAKRYHATTPSGPIELGATPAPSSEENNSEVGETHFLDNLDLLNDADGLNSYGEDPHAGKTTACDGENDPQMDELNRLVMVAEMNVPFDVIFSGSCSKKLHKVVISKPSDGGGSGHVNETCDGEADSIERSEDGPVFNAPSGGEIERFGEPADHSSTGAPSGDVFKAQSEQLSGYDEIESPHTELFGEELPVSTEPADRNLDGSLEDSLGSFATKSETCSINNLNLPGFDKPSGGETHEPMKNARSYEAPLGNKTTENAGDYSWISTQMENAVHKLAQKYRTNESTCTLLDTLNNQINRLDEEILFYDTIMSSVPLLR